MKTSWMLFVGLSIFYAIMTVIYWQLGGEPVGVTAIALSGGLALIIGFYLWFTALHYSVAGRCFLGLWSLQCSGDSISGGQR